MTNIGTRLDNLNVGPVQPLDEHIAIEHPVMAIGRVHFWPGDDTIQVAHSKSTVVIWNYWFFGEAIRGIGPYKFINSHDDLSAKDCKSRRSRAVRVLNSLIKTAVDADMIQNQRQVGVENSAVIFDFAYKEMMRKLYPNQPDKRGGDLVLCAVYERLRKVDRADVDRLAT